MKPDSSGEMLQWETRGCLNWTQTDLVESLMESFYDDYFWAILEWVVLLGGLEEQGKEQRAAKAPCHQEMCMYV